MSDKTAAAKLDEIREGGASLLRMAYRRMDQTKEALEEGDFVTASTRAEEAYNHVSALANAQRFLGGALGTMLHAKEIEEGMNLRGIGVVLGVEIIEQDCPGNDHSHCVVAVTADISPDEPIKIPGDSEVVMVPED